MIFSKSVCIERQKTGRSPSSGRFFHSADFAPEAAFLLLYAGLYRAVYGSQCLHPEKSAAIKCKRLKKVFKKLKGRFFTRYLL